MYKIEKGIEIPKSAQWRHREWPFYQMDVGDSVLFAAEEAKRAGNAATAYSRAAGRKFCQRKVDGGMRIWRIE